MQEEAEVLKVLLQEELEDLEAQDAAAGSSELSAR